MNETLPLSRRALLDHIEQQHRRALPARWSTARLSMWHADQHRRYGGSLDHHHGPARDARV